MALHSLSKIRHGFVLLEDNKNTKLINDKLLKYAEKSNNKLDEIYEELELTNEKLDTSDKTLNIVSKN